jgi:predicted kinase
MKYILLLIIVGFLVWIFTHKPTVYLLVGIPLSGKSTWANRKKLPVISRDQIILELENSLKTSQQEVSYNLAFSTVNHSRVNLELQRRLQQANINRKDVIVDMTHLTRKHRAYTLGYFDNKYWNRVAVLFATPSISEIRHRNCIRTVICKKTTPDTVIQQMIKDYQPVSIHEGFTKITTAE